MNKIPQYTGPTISSICELLPRPLIMTGVFRDLLTSHFASPNSIEEADLRELIWRDDPTTSILIESIWRWQPQTTGHRPAVIIKRNRYDNRRVAIGDNRYQLPPADKSGDPHYWTLWVGSHTLFCLGGSGAQVELLASEVQRELTEFGPEIRQAIGLMRFEITEIGAISLLAESEDTFVVPITAGYAFGEGWSLRQQAPRLKRIALSTILDF